ncbi:thiamine pyrophosphate-binding protein [Streptomyces sp. Da 82-17]|uniref:thiamine pyrophosphate-binding protein n=1 Tax=Streptomyces sp. Da 82-17 TaxID=3377116 RepID=UPI0038D3BCDA
MTGQLPLGQGEFGSAERMSGGGVLVRALAAHGVDTAFGIPGTHNLEVYRHLEPYGIRHVTPRHEQGAGYAADAYARVTGRPGLAITTTGPALLNIAAAAGQAYSDSVPLLIVSPGMPLGHPRQSTGTLHEMRSQTEAMRGVTAFSHRASSVGEIEAAVARAFTLFRSGRPRPVHIEVPLDLLEAHAPTGPARLAPPVDVRRPDATAVREAAGALRRAGRRALVLGGGARGAADACLALAEELGAVVVTTANGKGVVDECHPLSLGVSLHVPAVQKALADCDAVLAVGTELAESDLWTAPPATLGKTLIRVDVDPAQMYAGVPAQVGLVGDARECLREVRRALAAEPDGVSADPDTPALVRELLHERDAATASRDARWLPYLRVLREVCAQDAVFTSDSAQCCYYGALPHLPLGPSGRYLHPTGFGTLGYALPAAVGVQAARPERQVVALSGDGGLQFSVQELATAVQRQLPLPVVVFDNGGYGEIRDEMTARGDRPTAVDQPPVDLPALCRAYGGAGERVTTPGAFAEALARALRTPGPTLITVPEETSA